MCKVDYYHPATFPHLTAAGASILDRRSGADLRIDTTLGAGSGTAVTPGCHRNPYWFGEENFRAFRGQSLAGDCYLSVARDVPRCPIGVVFDLQRQHEQTSWIGRGRAAGDSSCGRPIPEDEFFLVQFNDRPELTVPFTPRPEDIQSHLTRSSRRGWMAPLDGVAMAMNEMKKARNGRKALLIISDGGTEADLRRARYQVGCGRRCSRTQSESMSSWARGAAHPKNWAGRDDAAIWPSKPARKFQRRNWRICRTSPPRFAGAR